MTTDVPVQTLNFVVVGNVRSGTSVVQTSINNRPAAVCHANLFHDDEAVRQKAHESYFGKCNGPEPEWYIPGMVSPWQYISHQVFDNPRKKERATGLRITYPSILRLELFSFFQEKYIEGDFCIVHVERNPVACLISQKQAQASGIWSLNPDKPANRVPMPLSLDPEELVPFCRSHLSLSRKIRNACPDSLRIEYADLHFHYQAVMRKVWDFLELDPDSDEPAKAGCARLRNNTVRDRIMNYEQLRRSVPSDVRALLDAEDLF